MKDRSIIINSASIILIILLSVGCFLDQSDPNIENPYFTVTFDSEDATTEANPSSKRVTSPSTTIDSLPMAPDKVG